VKQGVFPRVLLALGSALAGVFVVELALLLMAPRNELESRANVAGELGRPFDIRSRLEVVESLREAGLDAWPTMKPYLLIAEEQRHRSSPSTGPGRASAPFLFPLGGISASTSVYCNEGGAYAVFETDEHGFRNRRCAHRPGVARAVIIGDSFGNGACVQTGRDPASLLSVRGLPTVSLASPGNGPLIELATLVEYSAPLEPPIVLWLYFEGNDLKNLEDEMQSETLRQYLREGFSQNLVARQAQIDSVLRQLSDEWEPAARAEEDRSWQRQLRALATLYHVRRLFGWGSEKLDHERAIGPFCRVMERAASIVAAWGGRMSFVYLPSWYRYVPGKDPAALETGPAVRGCVEQAGIPFIDFDHAIGASEDPLRFFSLGPNPHYNELGYERLADTILSEISGGPP
jgi:hypothetical protein